MTFLSQWAPGDLAVRLVVSVIAQVTCVILIAALASRASLARHAAARHALWLGTLAWVLVSPVIAAIADRGGVTLLVVGLPALNARTSPLPVPTVPDDDDPLLSTPTAGSRGAGESPAARPVRLAPISERSAMPPASVRDVPVADAIVSRGAWSEVMGGLTVVWAAGVLVAMARMLAGWLQVARSLRLARPLDSHRHGEVVSRAREALGSTVLPPVVTSPVATGPFAGGLIRPRVVLPEGVVDVLTADELRDVLVHESAHILRHDPRVGVLQRLAAALFWPHPLVHYLNAQLDRAREEVCDNFVLRCGDRCGYVRHFAVPDRALPVSRPFSRGARLADRPLDALRPRRRPS